MGGVNCVNSRLVRRTGFGVALALASGFVAAAGAIYFVDREPEGASTRYQAFAAKLRSQARGTPPDLRYFRMPPEFDAAGRRARLGELGVPQAALLVTLSTDIAMDWRDIGSKVPLVFATLADPRDLGFARPDGSRRFEATGLMLAREPIAKQLELLREWAGPQRRVGLLADRYWMGSSRGRRAVALVESITGEPPVVRLADSPGELERTLKELTPSTAQGWLVVAVPHALAGARAVVDRFQALGRPVVYANMVFVDAGGIMSFEAKVDSPYERLAALALEVYRGTPASEIPFEGPFDYRLAINVAAAERSPIPVPKKLVRRAQVFR